MGALTMFDPEVFRLFVHPAEVVEVRIPKVYGKSPSWGGDFAKGTDEQKVGDLYKSYLNMDARNERGVAPLQPEFERIAAISNRDELAVYFAGATKRGYGMPFGLAQFPDMRNPEYYGVYAFQAGLGLPDREYYFTEDDNSAELRSKYVAHIAKMFDLAGLADGAAAADYDVVIIGTSA